MKANNPQKRLNIYTEREKESYNTNHLKAKWENCKLRDFIVRFKFDMKKKYIFYYPNRGKFTGF